MSREGWICPKCGGVYAPHVSECLRCNGPKPAQTDTNANRIRRVEAERDTLAASVAVLVDVLNETHSALFDRCGGFEPATNDERRILDRSIVPLGLFGTQSDIPAAAAQWEQRIREDERAKLFPHGAVAIEEDRQRIAREAFRCGWFDGAFTSGSDEPPPNDKIDSLLAEWKK